MSRVAVSGRLGGGLRGGLARAGFEVSLGAGGYFGQVRLVWDAVKMAVMKGCLAVAVRLGLGLGPVVEVVGAS